MDERILFEQFLFGDEKEININDVEFCVDRILMLPKIRPHELEKAVSLTVQYCQITIFREKLLKKHEESPVLIYQLYKRGIFIFEEIEPLLIRNNIITLHYYFLKEIKDLGKFCQIKDILDGFANFGNLDQLIEYGFVPSSIEYCLKYDIIDDMANFHFFNQTAQWSLFEWSFKPRHLDLLSFSGFFGSIRCFKHLLLNGFVICDNVISMVACSGSLDLFHLCQGPHLMTIESLCRASEFFHLSLMIFLLDNGVPINAKDDYDYSPLHYSSKYGHLSVVEYLINQDADINIKNKDD